MNFLKKRMNKVLCVKKCPYFTYVNMNYKRNECFSKGIYIFKKFNQLLDKYNEIYLCTNQPTEEILYCIIFCGVTFNVTHHLKMFFP